MNRNLILALLLLLMSTGVSIIGAEPRAPQVVLQKKVTDSGKGWHTVVYCRPDGQVVGTLTSYDEAGHIRFVQAMKDGKKEGLYLEYGDNGALRMQGQYHQDVAVGDFFTFDEKGTLTSVEHRPESPPVNEAHDSR